MERLDGVQLTDLAAIRGITTADPEQTLVKCVLFRQISDSIICWLGWACITEMHAARNTLRQIRQYRIKSSKYQASDVGAGLHCSALNVWTGSVVGCPTFHADLHAGKVFSAGVASSSFLDLTSSVCI